MATNVQSIKMIRGDTSEIVTTSPKILGVAQTIDALSPAEWTCQVGVVGPSDAPIFSPQLRDANDLSADSKSFEVALTPAESELLAVTGNETCYTMVIIVENANTVPPYKQTGHVELLVKERKL